MNLEGATFDLGRAECVVREFRLPNGLILTGFKLQGGPARIGIKPFRLELANPASFQAEVSAESLQAFLNESAPSNARDFQVRFEDGRIHVGATVRVLLEVRVEAVCRLEIEEGRRLCVRLVSADVLGVGASGMVERQMEALNPIVDTSSWVVPVNLDSVTIESSAIRMEGSLKSTGTT